MFHFHKYKVIQGQQGYGSSFSSLTLEKTADGIPITTLLARCEKCGKIKTKNIEGHWDISKLQ